jgi:hypothetical protein
MPREYRFAISALSAAVLLLFVLTPEHAWSSVPSVCLFKNLFGFECFGCGMTRALSAASHGNLRSAMAQNAGIVVLIPGLLAVVLQPLWYRR